MWQLLSVSLSVRWEGRGGAAVVGGGTSLSPPWVLSKLHLRLHKRRVHTKKTAANPGCSVLIHKVTCKHSASLGVMLREGGGGGGRGGGGVLPVKS